MELDGLVKRMLPRIDLADLLLEVHRWTGIFARYETPTLPTNQTIDEEIRANSVHRSAQRTASTASDTRAVNPQRQPLYRCTSDPVTARSSLRGRDRRVHRKARGDRQVWRRPAGFVLFGFARVRHGGIVDIDATRGSCGRRR